MTTCWPEDADRPLCDLPEFHALMRMPESEFLALMAELDAEMAEEGGDAR